MNNVDHPEHYNQGSIECIDALEACLTEEEFKGFLKGNAIKYLWRCEDKENELEDIKKAQWYLKRLKKLVKDENSFEKRWPNLYRVKMCYEDLGED